MYPPLRVMNVRQADIYTLTYIQPNRGMRGNTKYSVHLSREGSLSSPTKPLPAQQVLQYYTTTILLPLYHYTTILYYYTIPLYYTTILYHYTTTTILLPLYYTTLLLPLYYTTILLPLYYTTLLLPLYHYTIPHYYYHYTIPLYYYHYTTTTILLLLPLYYLCYYYYYYQSEPIFGYPTAEDKKRRKHISQLKLTSPAAS